MVVNLLNVLKEMPLYNFTGDGYAIAYTDIYQALKEHGIENQDLLNFELKKLADAGTIELFSTDYDLIYAVRLK